jgi:hypothetical protein
VQRAEPLLHSSRVSATISSGTGWSSLNRSGSNTSIRRSVLLIGRRSLDEERVCPLTRNCLKAYDFNCTRLKDSEIPDAFRAGNPTTHSFPRPYRPGEDGVLGFVRSVPPSKTTKPRDPPRPVDLGVFYWGGCNPPKDHFMKMDMVANTHPTQKEPSHEHRA